MEYYRLEQTEDRGLILFWAKNSSPVAEISVPDEAVQKVTELIMQYRLYTIKSSYKPPCHVLDGTMWHMYYRYSKDSTTCSCDNAWPPNNLWKGILAINAYLNSFVEAASEQTPLSAQPEHEAEP